MNQKEFLSALAETKDRYKWKLTPTGHLRGKLPPGDPKSAWIGPECCPITAVVDHKTGCRWDLCDADRAASEDLDMEYDVAENIIEAADMGGSYDQTAALPLLRRKMCEAVGVEQ